MFRVQGLGFGGSSANQTRAGLKQVSVGLKLRSSTALLGVVNCVVL